jgi:YVTN family beta-propeller protein
MAAMRISTGLHALTLGLALLAAACTSGPAERAASEAWANVAVSLETDGQVAIVDPAAGTVIARIDVGKRPRGMRASPDGRRLYVALSGSPINPPGTDPSTLPPADRSADGIGVIDLESRTLMRTLPSGQDPEAFDISPDGRTLYISNEETAEMTALDLETGEFKGVVKVGEEPEGVGVRPDGGVVYVTCEETNEVVAVDTRTLEVIAHMPTGGRPRWVLFTPDGSRAFVSAEVGGNIAEIDAQRHEILGAIPITAPPAAPNPLPMGLALDSERGRLYVATGRGRGVAVVDVASRSQIATIPDVGQRPWGIALSADNRFLYTANGTSGDVSVIDTASNGIVRRIPVGGRPWGAVLVP